MAQMVKFRTKTGKLVSFKVKAKSVGRKIKSKLSGKVKRRKSPRKRVAAKQKTSRRHKASAGFKSFSKGFLGGNGASELSDELTTFVTQDPRIKIPVKLAAGAAGGYYTGGKVGLIGGLVATGADIVLSILNGKDFFSSGGVGQSRL